MSDLEEQILQLLKDKYIATGFISKEDCNSFYLMDLKKNWFEKEMSEKTRQEYMNGDGKELEISAKKQCDMQAIRSSSAMIYNILGNGDVVFKNNSIIPSGSYKKEFEFKYHTLNLLVGKNRDKPVEANIDAHLYDEGTEVFIESKHLEWLLGKKSKGFGKGYFLKKYYFHKDTFDIFYKTAKNMDLEQYDGEQMFRHTMAIYNYLKENNIKRKKIYLLNVVWEIPPEEVPESIRQLYSEKLNAEHEEFEIFRENMSEIINLFPEHTECELQIEYVPVKDFIGMLECEEDKLRFLQRYM